MANKSSPAATMKFEKDAEYVITLNKNVSVGKSTTLRACDEHRIKGSTAEKFRDAIETAEKV